MARPSWSPWTIGRHLMSRSLRPRHYASAVDLPSTVTMGLYGRHLQWRFAGLARCRRHVVIGLMAKARARAGAWRRPGGRPGPGAEVMASNGRAVTTASATELLAATAASPRRAGGCCRPCGDGKPALTVMYGRRSSKPGHPLVTRLMGHRRQQWGLECIQPAHRRWVISYLDRCDGA